jgi:3-carboxy-cis,cis-muconate cycloisomerase
MPARLIDSLATTGPLADLFSDDSVLQGMLDFETALARAEAGLGIVPASAAAAIEKAARTFAEEKVDFAKLAEESRLAATPSIPFVKLLTERVRKADAAAAGFVHWGATSQDVADTALVLLLVRSRDILAGDLAALEAALRGLSEQHAGSVMLGRTVLQAAPPVTFGLAAAGWLGAIRRSRARLEAAFGEALVLQLGGASGTLAALGSQGVAVAEAMARELGLGLPDAPWHTQRDRLAAVMAACGVLTGCLGKMARDISLLMQTEVAEVAEPGGEGRGGSSTMPQKRNPALCVVTLAAANRVPGLVSSFLSSMVQEHERAAGGWQAEWPTVAAVIQSTGVAAASMAQASAGLSVDTTRMRANIAATNGAVFSERAMMLLGASLGRDAAYKLLAEAVRKSAEQKRKLGNVLGEMPQVTKAIDKKTLAHLDEPEGYLGMAETFRTRLLGDSPPKNKPSSQNSRKKKE